MKMGEQKEGVVVGFMGAWMWVRMIVEWLCIAVDSLNQTPFLSPHHTCSDCLHLITITFQFHHRLSSFYFESVLLI